MEVKLYHKSITSGTSQSPPWTIKCSATERLRTQDICYCAVLKMLCQYSVLKTLKYYPCSLEKCLGDMFRKIKEPKIKSNIVVLV